MRYRNWNSPHPFTQRVARELKRRSHTAAWLSRQLGYSPTSGYVGQVLNGWRKPSPRFQRGACHLFCWPIPACALEHQPPEPRPLSHVVTRIKEAATNQGRSTAWLARAAGMPAWQVEQVLAGHRRLGTVPRKRLYQALGLR